MRSPRKKQVNHGLSYHPMYAIWQAMVARCTSPRHASYHRFGGRGIRVDERWMSVQNFFDDMGERPEGMWLSRIDHDGHYSKDNCCWKSPGNQRLSRPARDGLKLTFNGATRSVRQWSQIVGVSVQAIYRRHYSGQSVAQVLRPTTPRDQRRMPLDANQAHS